VEIGDQGHSGQRAIDGGGSAADQRSHRSAFDAPRYGKKTSARSDHGVAFGDGGNQRWYDRVRQWSRGPPVFCARYGAVLVIALWMTIDLDYPGTGLIRVSNLPVVETLAAMN
jgi:hypothetical protein